LREFYQERNLDEFVVQRMAVLPGAVIQEFFAVIRDEDDGALLIELFLFEEIDKFSEPVIECVNAGVVDGFDGCLFLVARLFEELLSVFDEFDGIELEMAESRWSCFSDMIRSSALLNRFWAAFRSAWSRNDSR